MIKVVALEKGYYLKRRHPGDVFYVPFAAAQIEKSTWLARVGTKKANPPRREIPEGRAAPMADVLKGIPVDDLEPEPETMSEVTAAVIADEERHPKAYGLDPEAKPRRRRGRPKGSRNKPKADEVTP